jgi:hypothetical protein
VPNQIAMREERSVDLNIRIRPSLKKELEWRASREGSTLSNWIERTLEARVDSPTLIPSPTPAPLVPTPEPARPDRQRQAPVYLLQIVPLSALSWASMFLVVGIILALRTLALTAACAIGLLLSPLALESIFRIFWQQTGPSSTFCIAEKAESFLPITDTRVAPSINKCPDLTGGYDSHAVTQAWRAAQPSAVASPGGAVSGARTSSASSMT